LQEIRGSYMKMNHSLLTGFSFGSTSGVITTLGLMIGLHSGTHSKLAVLGGILTIAIADAFSDALGIHVSEEFENKHSDGEIWLATLSTFIAKFVVALTFTVPILLWPFTEIITIPFLNIELPVAMTVAVLWGLFLIMALSIKMARQQGAIIKNVVFEHLIIVIMVITITHYVGHWISTFSNGSG
jgi:vacuolar iron transporter family protein